jgi:hypothetical protein
MDMTFEGFSASGTGSLPSAVFAPLRLSSLNSVRMTDVRALALLKYGGFARVLLFDSIAVFGLNKQTRSVELHLQSGVRASPDTPGYKQ